MNELAQKASSETAPAAALRLPFSLSRITPGPRVGACLLFFLAYAIVSATISLSLRATSPEPKIDMLSTKLETLAANADAYDTIFLGTSRTLYHVIPDEVESAAAEAGCPGLNTFNLGVYGMTGSEQDWVLNRLLETRSDKLTRIVIEPPLPEYRFVRETLTSRSRFFHGPDNHADAIASIASYGESLPKRAFRAGVYAIGTLYDLSGVGRAAQRVFPDVSSNSWPPMSMAEDGFEALNEQSSPDIEARHQEFLDDPGKADYQLDLYGNPSPNIDARADYMLAKMQRIEATGVEPVLFVSPDFMELDRTPQTADTLAAKAPNMAVLNFNRPDAYPTLFDRSLWHDFSHFNRTGATQLSRTLGTELCAASTTKAEDLHAVR